MVTRFLLLLLLLTACKKNITGPTEIDIGYGELSADYVHSVLKPDGTVWSWGDNTYGSLGDGTTQNHEGPVKAINLQDIIAIDQSYGAMIAADKLGNIWFWGNSLIYLGPHDVDIPQPEPIKISQIKNAVTISINGVFIYVLKKDGSVWFIQLDKYTPTVIRGPQRVMGMNSVAFLSKNLAVSESGQVYELSAENSTLLSGAKNFITVSGRFSRHILALDNNGDVWAWGNNDLGQLGNGTFTDSNIPVKVSKLSNIKSISANHDYNLALEEDGTVWFWGFEGEEGDSLKARNIPLKIDGIDDVVLISASYKSLLMKENESYWQLNTSNKELMHINL